MAKVDLASMFHQLPLHPAARRFFAFRQGSNIFLYHRTPFGASPIPGTSAYPYPLMTFLAPLPLHSSRGSLSFHPFPIVLSIPGLANTLTSEVSRVLTHYGIPNVNMTIFITAASYEECLRHLRRCLEILDSMGWLVSKEKIEGPSQVITFLGIQINSINQTLSICHSRIQSYAYSLTSILQAAHVSTHDLESMVGKLQWLTSVFTPGRPYLSEFYATVHNQPRHRHVRISDQLREDMIWWQDQFQLLLSSSQPLSHVWSRYFHHQPPQPFHLFSDAAGPLSPKYVSFSLVYKKPTG